MSARRLLLSVKHKDRIDFARAVVFAVISAYWKELQTVSDQDWSLCELPTDIEVAVVSMEARDLAENIGTAVAGLDVMDASYMIGVLYTGMMPGKFRGETGDVLHAAGAVRAIAGHGDRGRYRLAFGAGA